MCNKNIIIFGTVYGFTHKILLYSIILNNSRGWDESVHVSSCNGGIVESHQ